jgi:hypothetical protein
MLRITACSLLSCLAAAQTKAETSPRVLAHGIGAAVAGRWLLARSAAELRQYCGSWRIAVPDVANDLAGALALVAYGKGRSGPPWVTFGQWGEDASAQLIRLAGRAPPIADGRWVLLSVPAEFAPHRHNLRFERDVADEPLLSVWGTVGIACTPAPLERAGRVWCRGAVRRVVLQDPESWLRFCREHLEPSAVLPHFDFGSQIALVMPNGCDADEYVANRWLPLGCVLGRTQTIVRLGRYWLDESDSAGYVSLHAVPRRVGELVFERTDAEDGAQHETLERLVVAPPASVLVRWLRVFEVEPQDELCERSDSAAAWEQLRARFKDLAAAMHEPCDFATDAMLLAVLPATARRACVGLAVDTEEGVDVLTISGHEPFAARDRKSTCVVLKVQRRRSQLAVVAGGAFVADGERTLRVFDGR